MISIRTTLSALVLLSCTSYADTIHKTDGTSIEDCTIVLETLEEVTYKASGNKKERSVPSDEVLKVEFEKRPAEIDRALEAIREGQLLAAVSDLTLYLEGIKAGKSERRKWASPVAIDLLIQQFKTMGEADEVLIYCAKMIDEQADSRYVPMAYLTRAQTLFEKGEASKAKKVIENFVEVIDSKGLSKRWQLECDLGVILYDPELTGEKRRDKLVIVSSNAGSKYPTVRNRADVAEAQSLLKGSKFADAEVIFQRISTSTNSDVATRAAAFTGLGDCLFQKASGMTEGSDEAKATLKAALMSYLRVTINYKNQTGYVAKSLFYAARCFDLMGGDAADNAQKLYRRVRRNFPGSQWAKESTSFLKKR